MIVTTLWYSGFSLLNAFALGPTGLFVTRLLTGVGLSAMTVVGITYISEMFPADKRGTYQGWIMTIGLCGIPGDGVCGAFLRAARAVGMAAGVCLGFAGDSVSHLRRRSSRNRRCGTRTRASSTKADEVLDRLDAAARSGKRTRCLRARCTARWSLSRWAASGTLFAAVICLGLLLLVLAWICQTLGFYGFTAWVPTLLVAHGFSLVQSLAWSSAMSLGAVPGALIAALISDRWNRKCWIAIVALLIAACGLTYGLSFRTGVIVVFGFLVTMLIQTFAPLLYAYTAECFPTGIRNSGTGLTYGVGRLANAFGPLLVAFLYGALRLRQRVRLHRDDLGAGGPRHRRLWPAHQGQDSCLARRHTTNMT